MTTTTPPAAFSTEARADDVVNSVAEAVRQCLAGIEAGGSKQLHVEALRDHVATLRDHTMNAGG
jgi:hypothetical protein